jgi:hypothetical protein
LANVHSNAVYSRCNLRWVNCIILVRFAGGRMTSIYIRIK